MVQRSSRSGGRASRSVSNQSEASSLEEQKAVNDLTKNFQHFGQTATDPVVVNLEIIPKLLFEGMVSQEATTVEAAVENLADIFRLSGEKRMEAYEAGGHAVLVVTMKAWRENESIQTSSCRCIQNMSCTNSEAKESFASVGGLESVVNAMRAFPNSQRVQRSGCGALMNLLSGTEDDSELLESMSEKFVNDYEGIALIVTAMRNFPEELKIQLWGNGLFQNLAQTKSYRREMMISGAVTAAGSAMERHPEDKNITQYASKFMKIMFSKC